jgi:hypothetical protein
LESKDSERGRLVRGFKFIAIAIAAVIAIILAFTVVGFVIHALIYVALIALAAGGVYVAFKAGRASNKHVSDRDRKNNEVKDSRETRPLPRADVQQYSPPPPPPPVAAHPVSRQNVDDELAKLKREMGS